MRVDTAKTQMGGPSAQSVQTSCGCLWAYWGGGGVELDTSDGNGTTLLQRVCCAHTPSPQAPCARAPLGLQVPNSSWPELGGGLESLPLGSPSLCLTPEGPHGGTTPPFSHIATSLDSLSPGHLLSNALLQGLLFAGVNG